MGSRSRLKTARLGNHELRPERKETELVQQSPAYLVERFYYDLWNTANETLAWEILHPDFRFRASLGPEKIGPCGFIEYMRLIHTALSSYWCTPGDAGDRRTRRSPIAFQWSPSRHVLRHASNRPRDRVDRCSLLSHHRPSDRFPMGLGRRRCRQTAARRSVDKLRSVRPPRLSAGVDREEVFGWVCPHLPP